MSYVINKPVAGFYKRRLVKGGPWVGVEIRFDQPNDPLTGEKLDRSPRWMAWTDGKESDPIDAWNASCDKPITKEEYDILLRQEPPVTDWKRNAKIF